MVASSISREEKLTLGGWTHWPTALPDEVIVAVARAANIHGGLKPLKQAADVERVARRLVERMEPYLLDATVQRAGGERLLYLARHHAAAVASAGGARALVAGMRAHRGDKAVQLCGCRLAGMRACADAVVEAGGEEAVLSAMMDFTDAELQSAAFVALGVLTRRSLELAPRQVEKSTVDLFLARMDSHLTCADLQADGCKTLGLWASSSALSQGEVVSCLHAVIDAMRSHLSSVAVQLAGSQALCSLIERDESCKQEIVDRGGAELLSSAVELHGANLQLCPWICTTVKLTASGKESQRKLVLIEAGFVEGLVEAMQTHAGHVPIQREACTCLRVLASGNSNCKHGLSRAGAIPVLLAALQVPPVDVAIHRESCETLRHITSVDPLKALESGAVAVLVMSMRSHPEDEAIQFDGRKALSNISQGDPFKCRRAIVAAGGPLVVVPPYEYDFITADSRARWDVLKKRPDGVPTFSTKDIGSYMTYNSVETEGRGFAQRQVLGS